MSSQTEQNSCKLLEINLLSAFDLDPSTSDVIKIYAVVWIDQNQKFYSPVLDAGSIQSWNQRFIFILEAKALDTITTAHAVVELYSEADDKLLGTSRAVLGLLGNCSRHYADNKIGARRQFHIRRPEGHTQGVLSIGFTVLEGLDLSEDKLVATGLAIDCKSLLRQSVAISARNHLSSGLLRRLLKLH